MGADECVYTVGHSNQSLSAFLALLARNAIEVLVDVRSNPVSRYAPHFTRGVLEPAVKAAGVEYVFLGKELGGKPQSPEFYDSKGRVAYEKLAASPPFRGGMERLRSTLGEHRTAIMCSEEDPRGCHRTLLIGHELSGHGVAMFHIRKDGQVESQEDLLRNGSDRRGGTQLGLFNSGKEVPWQRSLKQAVIVVPAA